MAGRHSASSRVTQARREQRQERRRARMAERMARAGTPSERVGAVADHLRAVLPYLPAGQAERIGDDVVRVLSVAVEQAYRIEQEEARA